MPEPPSSGRRTVLQITVTEAEAGRLRDLATTSHLAQVRPEMIRHYCEIGLLNAVEREDALWFDDDALFVLRLIESLRSEELSLPGIKAILGLMNEVERLKEEIRFLRSW